MFALGRGLNFTSRIARWNAGVGRQLAVENSTAWVAGDVLRAEADGTTLQLYRNNGLVLVTTDATIASGRAGITIYAATIADVELALARATSKLEAYPVKYRGDRLLLSRPSSRALCVLKDHLLFWKMKLVKDGDTRTL